MNPIFWLLDTTPAPFWPGTLLGWLGWFVFLGLLIWLLWRERGLEAPWNRRNLIIFAGLALAVVLANLFVGLRLPVGQELPLPGIPQEPQGPAIMLLSAIPLLLAGGILGPIAAGVLGLLAGSLRFLWDTQSIYTPLEMALVGSLFSLAVRQRYRTRPFALLRQPFGAALAVVGLYMPVFIIDSALVSSGTMAARLDYGLAALGARTLALGCEMLLGGLFMQVLASLSPGLWGRSTPLQPSPVERSLQSRFLFTAGALIVFLLVVLLAGDWLVAGAAARDMLYNRIKGAAEVSSQNVPYFLETGQTLAAQTAKRPELLNASGSDLQQALAGQVQSVPYFDQMLVFDLDKKLVGSYSSSGKASESLTQEEVAGLNLAVKGVLSQVYAIDLDETDPSGSARVSFIMAVMDKSNAQVVRILVARSDLGTNPFSQSLITSLNALSDLDGSGTLLGENGHILYGAISAQSKSPDSTQQKAEASFYDETGPDGTRNLVYHQPVIGQPWAVEMRVPAEQSQQMAVNIAAPLGLMIFVLTLVALVMLRLGLMGITNSLQTLAVETVRIAQGQLDHPLAVDGVDEVGELRRSFEQMRVSLQARMAELNRLLLVSQGVASSLDVSEAVQPLLEAVLTTGADAVRMVIPPLDEAGGQSQPAVLALGPDQAGFARYDEQVVALTRQKDSLFAADATRSLGSQAVGATPPLVSFFAIALRHENQKFGVLWAGYEGPHIFSDSEVRFLTTLAGQAALAASNHHLFQTAEVGRQRLAAILASTPDPVLVIDQFNRLLLANPAASEVLGAGVESGLGQPVETIIKQADLLAILWAAPSDKLSSEISLPNGRVYLATASPVMADERAVGRVCILRDVTHFKELDKMKTEFVSTVSHDLRSPLTTMRGYASMLDMLGGLNEQQQAYVGKIQLSVDNMTRQINALLDLGRVEAGVGLQLQIVPVPDLIEKAIAQLRPVAQQKKIEMNLSLPAEVQTLIEVDPDLFQRAVSNLVENAIKYTPQGGRVTIAAKLVGNDLLLAVQDNGIGIAPADQPHLFEKFYRGGQREARAQKGSGLGLAIVKSVIEHHGGRVWVESQLGKGSAFFVQVALRQPRPLRD